MADLTANLGPLLAFAGTVVTALSVVAVAVWTNRSEKQQSAKTAVELGLEEQLEAKDERLLYRDEIILNLRAENEAPKIENRTLREQNERYLLAIREGRAEERERTNGHEI
jgi:hypothetical protein